MELFASTVIWDGDGKLTVYDKTQGVQNVQRYLCGVFEHEAGRCARHVALRRRRVRLRAAPAIPGGAGGARRRARWSARCALVLTRAADVRARLSAGTIERARARREGRRNARRDHARGDRGDLAIRGFCPQRHRLVRRCSTNAPTRRYVAQAGAARSCRPPATCARRARRPASMRSNARWTSSPSRSSSIRSSCACAAIRTATRTRTFPTPARSCANATARARRRSAGTSATPSRARCATAASWSAGAWRPASGKRCRCRPPPASC